MTTVRIGARPLFRLQPRDAGGAIVDLTGADDLKIVIRRPTPTAEPWEQGSNVVIAGTLVSGYIEARPPTTSEIDRVGAWEAYAGFTIGGVEYLTLSTKFTVIAV
jgi:hypothetical protein